MKNLIFIFLLFSCNPLSVPPMANYIIDKGEHQSYYYDYFNHKKKNIIAPIFLRGSKIKFSFIFKEYHKYNYLIKNGEDINKLYGITSIKIHQNSARFGWRYVGDENFEVFTYSYINGIRTFKLMDIISIGTLNMYSVDVSNNNYTYKINDKEIVINNTKKFLVARSFPYFGGNNITPHKMYFLITEK